MQKQKKQFLIACVLLILCAAAFFIMTSLQKQQKEKEEAAAEADLITVDTIKADTIDRFTYQYNGEELTFEKKEGTWVFAADPSIKISQSMITSMLSYAAELTADQQITEPGDLKEYGFDAPQNTITLQAEDAAVTVTIGSYNTMTSQYYLMVSGDSNVYLVGDGIFTAFQKGVADLTEPDEDETQGEAETDAKEKGESHTGTAADDESKADAADN